MAKRVRSGVRVVQAPEPQMMSSLPPANCVLSVALRPGEDVEWIWTAHCDGGNYVSGYRIISARLLGNSGKRAARRAA